MSNNVIYLTEKAESQAVDDEQEKVSIGEALNKLASLLERDAEWIDFHLSYSTSAYMVAVNLRDYAKYLREHF
ncbi:MAG: hypothetical protein ABW088_00585 [Sedimenticola sp.]